MPSSVPNRGERAVLRLLAMPAADAWIAAEQLYGKAADRGGLLFPLVGLSLLLLLLNGLRSRSAGRGFINQVSAHVAFGLICQLVPSTGHVEQTRAGGLVFWQLRIQSQAVGSAASIFVRRHLHPFVGVDGWLSNAER